MFDESKRRTELTMTFSTRRAALLLLALTVVFFGPTFWPAEGRALGTLDMRGLFYPWLEHVRLSLTGGHGLPWWDATRFSGYPFLSNPQVAILYPPTWLAVLLPTRIGISLFLALHLWLGGLGVVLLARDWLNDGKVGLPALLAGVTFTFAGFFTARLYAGHMGLIAVHVWIPWLLWATWRLAQRRDWKAAVFAAVPLSLAILAGHTTSLLYVGLVWGTFALYLLFTAARGERLKLAARLAAAGGLGLILAAGQLLPLAEFAVRAARTAQADFEFATDFSFPLAHLVTLLVPEYFGEPTRAGYWSVPNFEELTAYIGLLPWLGFLLALGRPRRRTWLLVGLALLGLLLALGRYGFLYRLLYDWVPPFRLARAPGRAMFLVVLSGSLLVAEGLVRWQDAGVPRWWRGALALSAAGGLLVLAATGTLFAAQHPTDTSGRLWHQLGGWAWATLLLAVAGLLLARWLSAPAQRGRLGAALVLLAVADLWTFGYKLRQLSPMSPDAFWSETAALLGEGFDGRVLPWGISIFAQNGAGQVGLNSLFGYNALELGAYTTLTGSVPDPRARSFDVLAATHVVATTPLDQFAVGDGAITLSGQQGSAWVYARSNPLPLARLVTSVEVQETVEAAVARLHQPDFDPARTALVNRPVACASGGPPGSVTIDEQAPGRWLLTAQSDAPALLVLAETAYPGWRASVDGQAVDWVVAYGALRAVCVPAGSHTVSWEYVPVSFRWGGALATLGWLLVAGALLARRRQIRQAAGA